VAGNVGINSSASHSHLFDFCIFSFLLFVCVTQFIRLQALTFDMPIGNTEKLDNTFQGVSTFFILAPLVSDVCTGCSIKKHPFHIFIISHSNVDQ